MIETMGRVGDFCRSRQTVSHHSEPVPQIGVVFSGASLYKTANKCFGGWGPHLDGVRGWVDALVAAHYSVDVIPDWRLDELLPQYKFIVLPEWPGVPTATLESLRRWSGGTLLVAGVENAAAFGLDGTPLDQPAYCPGSEVLANLKGRWLDFQPGKHPVLEWRYPDLDSTRDRAPLAVSVDNKVLVPGPLGSIYTSAHAPAVLDLIRRLVRFEPLVELKAPPTVEMALRRKDGRLLVHLLNTANMQVAGDYAAIDFIPPVGPVRLRFRSPVRDASLVPGAPGLHRQGDTITLDRLEVHAAISVI